MPKGLFVVSASALPVSACHLPCLPDGNIILSMDEATSIGVPPSAFLAPADSYSADVLAFAALMMQRAQQGQPQPQPNPAQPDLQGQ